ncbi:MAG TPA: PDR/VanB family oxidoreductase [Acidiphilium sp.]|nr:MULTISPECIES: PDR/VanB family oxidoreductase [unclassified Acidiphilium]HQT89811.1 PDR/VanB family oxidoreductase [Acidiphilium sp.]
MILKVTKITNLAEGINAYDLIDPGGCELPEFTAGAHVDLHLRNGLIRQYSLCGDPSERSRYTVGVLREQAGRGGSAFLHDNVLVGTSIEVSVPRNNFRLVAAERYVFIAGGIGITPIIPMLGKAQARGTDFKLYYCTRSLARTAFHDELQELCADGRAVIHHDQGDPTRGLDFTHILAEYEAGTHLYYCGPGGLMMAIGQASSHWPPASVHCEYFAAPARPAASLDADKPFRIRIADTRAEYEVPIGETIVNVLRKNGFFVDTSCETGYCGTCMTRYVGGTPDHRDTVLDAKSRENYVLICCARSRTPVLELDI